MTTADCWPANGRPVGLIDLYSTLVELCGLDSETAPANVGEVQK